MTYLDRHLLGGETVRFRTRLHWKVFVIPVLLTLVVCGPLIIWALLSDRKLLALIPASLALVILTGTHLYRVSSEFAVTNRRVVVKTGLLNTRSIELLLPKIEAIEVTQSLMGRIFGYGDIIVTGSGGTDNTFDDIQRPLLFRQAVQAAAESEGAATE
jgi:uncharacterized membrane protein YdbT with pleckstrin-like domain